MLHTDDAVALIVSEYDAFLATALPPVSLLPAVVTVSVPSRGWRFQLKVRPSDFVRDLEEAVTQQVLAAFGDTVQSFDGTWSLADVISADGAGGAGAILLSPATTLYVSCPGGRCVHSRLRLPFRRKAPCVTC